MFFIFRDFWGGNFAGTRDHESGSAVSVAVGALGQTPGNRSYFGQDIFIAAGQQVHNAVCLFCSVQVEGDVTGHVFVLFGSVNVSGQVRGGAAVIGGNAVVDSQARIGGDTVVLGGNAVYETDESLCGERVCAGRTSVTHLAVGAGWGRDNTGLR